MKHINRQSKFLSISEKVTERRLTKEREINEMVCNSFKISDEGTISMLARNAISRTGSLKYRFGG